MGEVAAIRPPLNPRAAAVLVIRMIPDYSQEPFFKKLLPSYLVWRTANEFWRESIFHEVNAQECCVV
jgi:hypothetical protein